MGYSPEDIKEATCVDFTSFLPEGSDVKETRPNTWSAKCPFHEDDRASLAIWRFEDEHYYAKCYGCDWKGDTIRLVRELKDLSFPKALREILGRDSADFTANTKPKQDLGKVVATYDYFNSDGAFQFQVRRYEPKTFRPFHKDENGEWKMGYGDTERVLYGEACWPDAGSRMYVVEGEKDVESLRKAGCFATTWSGGAENWSPFFADKLKGLEVVVIPDNDAPGIKAGRAVTLACMDRGIKVGYVLLPDGVKDVSELPNLEAFMMDVEDEIVWDKPVPPVGGE